MKTYPEIAEMYLAATGDSAGVKTVNGKVVLNCWQDPRAGKRHHKGRLDAVGPGEMHCYVPKESKRGLDSRISQRDPRMCRRVTYFWKMHESSDNHLTWVVQC